MNAITIIEALGALVAALAGAHYANYLYEIRRIRRNLHQIRNLMTVDRGRIWRIEAHLKLPPPPPEPVDE